MQEIKNTWKSHDGTAISSYYWEAENPTGVILLVHGLAEHAGRYTYFAEESVKRGWTVAAYDQRGHGLSEGVRCHVDLFSDYTQDLDLFIQDVQGRYPDLPLFLMGHSMGGTVCTTYCMQERPALKGLILSAPVLAVGDDISAFKIFLARLLGKIFPKLPLEKLNSDGLSHDPAVQKAYDEDPLVYRGGVRAGFGLQMLGALDAISANMEAIKLPLFLFHGDEDKLSNITGSRELFKRSGSPDKNFKEYAGFFHEVLNEVGKEQVVDDIHSWLGEHPA